MRSHRSLRRPAAKRSPKQKFIIYSEGKNTEPGYFSAVRRDLVGALIDIEIIDAAGTPMTIAIKACERVGVMKRGRRLRSSFEEDDQVWVVFDRDEHPRVREALELCRKSNVGVAFSDPCFELWLILHHTDFDRPDDRHQVQAELEKVCKGYDAKGKKTADFASLMPHIEVAEHRAFRQLTRRESEGDPPRRPFTTVFRLTKALRDAHLSHLGAG